MNEFIAFGQPLIEQEEIDEVVSSLKDAWLTTGPKVQRFEQDFADYKNVPSATALNSCTAALHLSCLALGLKPGDEVITTAMTFASSVNAIIHCGATPVLADVDPSTQLISPKEIRAKITPRTRAIMVVHLAGRPCDMDSIMRIAGEHDLGVIEDCAHAVETEYHGKPAGTFGDFGCFSFYATKNIITGEGGMVVGKDEKLLSLIKVRALHGLSHDPWRRHSNEGYRHYSVVDLGFKYNMMDIQAAIGIHQLKRVEKYWSRRREIWAIYMKAFRGLEIGLPAAPEPNTRHGFHLFSLRICQDAVGINRDKFLDAMTERNIGVSVHFLAIPEHPYYQERYGWRPEDCPNATAYGRETVSLPFSPKLSNSDVDRVIEAVTDILNG